MAKIDITQRSKVFTIGSWLGVNESPDGDTTTKLGEAVHMRNFRVTQEGYLQLRPGYSSVATIAEDKPVRGLWHGYVDEREVLICVCDGHAYSLNLSSFSATELGPLADAPTTMFGFSNKLYFLNGSEYKVWDGTTFGNVVGYAPIIRTACVPATGDGETLEQVNKISGSKRMRFSGDGKAVYKLAEAEITSVDEVIVDGVVKTPTTHYTASLATGTVTFTAGNIPATGTPDNVTIKYTKGAGADRQAILSQRFFEFYSGGTDARVFLYGDNTNKCYYSGIEHATGQPTAEYFPDLNEIAVDTSNTPITSLIRHYDKLVIFKRDDTFVAAYDTLTLEDKTVTAGFYVQPLNRAIGNAAPGQVQLVNNNPFSLHENSVFEWVTSSTRDERNARRISDRIINTLKSFDLSKCVTFDHQSNYEYWIVHDDTAIIYNYAVDTWYLYTNIPATCFVSIEGELYFGTTGGKLMRMSRDYHSDDGEDIDAYWESGSMAFGDYTYRKFLPFFHSAMLPEVGARISVTFQTDRKSSFTIKAIANNVLNFNHVDFNHWSFSTNRRPKTRRTKLKAKKFVYLKFILSSLSSAATSTILAVSFPVIYTNQVK